MRTVFLWTKYKLPKYQKWILDMSTSRTIKVIAWRSKKKHKSKISKTKIKSLKAKKALGPPNTDAAAIVEYLVYKPINSQKDATTFYKDIDTQWADDAKYVNVIIRESIKIDNLQHLQDAADKLLKSCKRKNTNGDCEDRAQDIITELKHYNNPKGKYTLEYHRAEYYIMPNSDEDLDDNSNNVESQDPEFVQNHAYVIAYNNKKDNQHWFRYNKHLT